MKVKIKLGEGATSPFYATTGAAGFDIATSEDCDIYPGERVLVPTGLFFEVPIGYELQIRPRSGVSLKTSLLIANSPGTVDSDYRGEVKIIMTNIGNIMVPLFKGDRIAQGVIQKVAQVDFEEVEELESTSRDAGGFGHTGKNGSYAEEK
jgi:dUTP pyrophosphatase